MRKMFFYFVTIVVIPLITAFTFLASEKNINVNFLKSYGWEVDPHEIEIEEIVIPKSFDSVYKEYNLLQKEAGLDLEKYKGKKAVRYTYKVLNYPVKNKNNVRANVICVDKEPIAGDIMTTALDGFMHSLLFPEI